MAARRRRFGQVRKLPSGSYQASFIGPAGTRQNAPQTFRTKTDAGRYLAQVEADLSRGTWLDDTLGRQSFGDYARAWLRDNPRMGPRYRETCARNLRLHMTALRTCRYGPSRQPSSANGTPPRCGAPAAGLRFSSHTGSCELS